MQAPYLKLEPGLQKDVKTFGNTQYIPLIKLCAAYGLDCKWDTFTKTATIEKKGKIILRSGSENILVNGEGRRLERPVLVQDGTVFVPLSFVRKDLGYIVERQLAAEAIPAERIPKAVVSKKFTIKTIVVDAGHGGKDAGALGRRFPLREKHMTLVVAKRLKKALEESGIRVIMTRERDLFVSLAKRVQIANENSADLFVSVHINASRSKSLSGFECYYLSETTDDNARALQAFENGSLKLNDDAKIEHSKALDATLWDMVLTENRRESIELAKNICKTVDKSLEMRSRGIRQARFYVLKGAHMPAILAELGYLSNRYEEMKLRNAAFLDKMAEILAEGILAYKAEYERTGGFTKV